MYFGEAILGTGINAEPSNLAPEQFKWLFDKKDSDDERSFSATIFGSKPSTISMPNNHHDPFQRSWVTTNLININGFTYNNKNLSPRVQAPDSPPLFNNNAMFHHLKTTKSTCIFIRKQKSYIGISGRVTLKPLLRETQAEEQRKKNDGLSWGNNSLFTPSSAPWANMVLKSPSLREIQEMEVRKTAEQVRIYFYEYCLTTSQAIVQLLQYILNLIDKCVIPGGKIRP
ncbi:14574_t:CDS:2 [Funneliformis geosporum]|uniref:14574_t:CDS:1 n=1 Tax=Funneliformis geosporum TaxID=1117311 RepID=A0A9W4SNL9_9GLOM|nr:14574_t:CDS:2 [Funneliformis geosporum]